MVKLKVEERFCIVCAEPMINEPSTSTVCSKCLPGDNDEQPISLEKESGQADGTQGRETKTSPRREEGDDRDDEQGSEDSEETLETVSKESNLVDSMTKPIIAATSQDRIPSLSHFPVITIYAYSVGHRGFRYATTPSMVSKTLWSKTMTGVQAMSFLRKVKTGNRAGRLESKTLVDA